MDRQVYIIVLLKMFDMLPFLWAKVFAGPNGSGKSTITRMAKTVGVYINADDIKKASLCSDMEAALRAEELREDAIANREDFTFETVYRRIGT